MEQDTASVLTGTLKNAEWAWGTRIYAQIYGDTRGRFKDGDCIYTSEVLELHSSGICRTRNSLYKVEWAEPAQVAA